MNQQTKKEIKKQYKQSLTPMGVYAIRCAANGKIFIGSAMNVPGKLNSHKFTLDYGSHINKELQKDYTAFGNAQFSFEMIDTLEPKEDPAYSYTEDLKTLEGLWLEKLQPYDDRGYNTPPKEKNR